jgi:hypothetical protein
MSRLSHPVMDLETLPEERPMAINARQCHTGRRGDAILAFTLEQSLQHCLAGSGRQKERVLGDFPVSLKSCELQDLV